MRDTIFVIEFKCDQSADAAIAQIREKGYDRAYQQKGKRIRWMGINFDSKKRNISDWKVC